MGTNSHTRTLTLEQAPANMALNEVLWTAIDHWNDTEANRDDGLRLGRRFLLAGTSEEVASHLDGWPFRSPDSDGPLSMRNREDPPGVVAPIFDRTKAVKHSLTFVASPDQYGDYGDLHAKAHAYASRTLGAVICSSDVQVSGLPTPSFSISESESTSKTRYRVFDTDAYGKESEVGRRDTKKQAIELAKTTLAKRTFGSKTLGIGKVVEMVDAEPMLTVTRERATAPVTLVVTVVVHTPLARAKQVGWAVSFSYHS